MYFKMILFDGLIIPNKLRNLVFELKSEHR